MSLDNLKDLIKEAPISQIISHYLSVQRKGSALVSLCPFHADTKPSLNINDKKNMFMCFACQAAGDSIKFVMDYKKLDFVEALKEISGILHLPFEEFQKEKKSSPKVSMAFRVLSAATKIYQKAAEQKHPAFIEFIEQRKLLPETIAKFELGFAPYQSALTDYLDKHTGSHRSEAIKVAEEIQLIRRSKNSEGYYDFFRERIMFPIPDHGGQIRGFSSRTVHSDQQPKYLNSVDSFIFTKGSILFAYQFAKAAIRSKDMAILVEGHMDVIMMHQHGFDQTVGTMGIAISDQALKTLLHLTKNLYLGMDTDQAGHKAMEKINAECMKQGVLPRYLSYAPHKDPDDFLKAEGQLALMKKIEEAPIFIDHILNSLVPEKIPDNVDMKIEISRKFMQELSPLGDHLQATERLIKYNRILGIKSSESTICEEYRQFLSKLKEKRPFIKEESQLKKEEESRDLLANSVPNSSLTVEKCLNASEKLILKQVITHPEGLTRIDIEECLAYISHSEVKNLLLWLSKIYFEIEESEYVSMVQDYLRQGLYGPEVSGIVMEALYQASGNKLNEKVVDQVMKDLVLRLRLDSLKEKRKTLVDQQNKAFSKEEVQFYLNEIARLDKEIYQLKNTPL